MPERVVYHEERENGDVEAEVAVAIDGATVSVSADLEAERATVTQLAEKNNAVISRAGLESLPYALREFEKRGYEIDVGGLETRVLAMARESTERNGDGDGRHADETDDPGADPTEEPADDTAPATPAEMDDSPEPDPDTPSDVAERVVDVLEEEGELPGPEIQDRADISQSEFYEAVSELEDDLSKRRDPDDGRRKLYSLSAYEDLWCGICGFGPKRTPKAILTHHGEAHGDDVEPDLRDEEPPLEEDNSEGYWCGRCGAGPFDEAIDVEGHQDEAHGQGNPIALEHEPDEDDLAGDVKKQAFTDWDGAHEDRRGTTPATDGGVRDV